VPALRPQIIFEAVGHDAIGSFGRDQELHARATPFPAPPGDFSFVANIDPVAVRRGTATLKSAVLHACFPPLDLERALSHEHRYRPVINALLIHY
jgi:hypothetical protein